MCENNTLFVFNHSNSFAMKLNSGCFCVVTVQLADRYDAATVGVRISAGTGAHAGTSRDQWADCTETWSQTTANTTHWDRDATHATETQRTGKYCLI